MANTFGPLAPDQMASDVQDFLNAMLVGRAIANAKFKDDLIAGDQLDFPYFNSPRVQNYTVSTNATIDATTAVQDLMTINVSRIATFNVDPVEVRQAKFKGFAEKLAKQAAFVLSQDMDQSIFTEAVAEAGLTRGTNAAPVSLTAGNIFSQFANSKADLAAENATDGELFAVIDPHRVSLLAQSEVANGFNKADKTLENGFVGLSSAGFRIYESNNLPSRVVLTVDTQPTAGDTFIIAGITWTCVADAALPVTGEIRIGADLADFQAIFVTAINGTAAPTANDYVLNVENRRRYQNRQLAAGAFAANASIITGFGRLNVSETFIAGTNVFGVETLNLLFGRMGAVSLGMQTEPNVLITQEPQNLSKNYLVHTLYGREVFFRDQRRIVNMTIAAA